MFNKSGLLLKRATKLVISRQSGHSRNGGVPGEVKFKKKIYKQNCPIIYSRIYLLENRLDDLEN